MIQEAGTASAKAQSLPSLESKAPSNWNCPHAFGMPLGFMRMEVKPLTLVKPCKISFLF